MLPLILLLMAPWLPAAMANPFNDFFDSIVNIDELINDPAYATWRKNTAVAVVQGFLVFASLADFAVFTLMFLYGTFLSMRVMPNWKRVSLVALTIVFLGFRFLYLPFITMLIPLQGVWYFPKPAFVVSFFGLAMFYIILLIVPLSFGIYWAIKYRLWRNARRMTHKVLKRAMIRVRKRIKKDRIPQMIVVMPIYNEDPEALKTAVHSVVQSIYPQARMTVFLSFDDDKESDLYLDLMQFLTKSDKHEPGKFPESCIVKYMGVRFVVNRFPHGGKRNTQALTFEQIQTMFSAVEDSAYVLFIDSDIILYPDCMIEFVRAMEKDANNLVGMTGFISAISSRERNMLCYFQDCEYMAGQVFWRSLEAALGGVTCLPGALTILRLKELSVAAKTYFSELKTESIFDFHRFHLGEDRYLTHLLMEQSKSYSIGFCPSARAKTETPGTMASLVKQRRRWLLGALSNVICFFCDFKLWLRFPLLMIFNFCDLASRSTAFFVHILLLQMLSGVQFSWLQIAIMLAPFVMRWMLLISFSFILKRFKASLVFPLMILVDPWANFFINVYAIWTWNTRSWGGPRATAQDEAAYKAVDADDATAKAADAPAHSTVHIANHESGFLPTHTNSNGDIEVHSALALSSTSSETIHFAGEGDLQSEMGRSETPGSVFSDSGSSMMALGFSSNLRPVLGLARITDASRFYAVSSSGDSQSTWDTDTDTDTSDFDSMGNGSNSSLHMGSLPSVQPGQSMTPSFSPSRYRSASPGLWLPAQGGYLRHQSSSSSLSIVTVAPNVSIDEEEHDRAREIVDGAQTRSIRTDGRTNSSLSMLSTASTRSSKYVNVRAPDSNHEDAGAQADDDSGENDEDGKQ